MTAVEKTAAQSPQPRKEDLVTVTIDGIEISVPKGTLLIRAAEQLGIQNPRFCDHPLLEPAGACRQCLVEVTDMGNGRGMPKPAASCASAAPGSPSRLPATRSSTCSSAVPSSRSAPPPTPRSSPTSPATPCR